MSKYYFAYGSNLDKQAMRFRCTSATPVGRGVLEGYKLVFRGGAYGYLTVNLAWEALFQSEFGKSMSLMSTIQIYTKAILVFTEKKTLKFL